MSFVPMEDLGIDEKIFEPTQTRPLANVAGSYTYFADGDVLLAKITPCFENGKLGIAANLTNGIGFGSSEFIVFRPDKSLTNEWLYYFLSQDAFRIEGAARMSGAVGHKRVAKEFVETYPIPIPPLPEQERIVGILDEAFDGIATAKANAERNLKNGGAIFESHLQSVFAQRGRGWVETNLGAEIDLLAGFAFKSAQYTDSDHSVRLLRGDNIVQGSLRWDDVKKWPASNASEYSRYQLRDGDVVLAMDRPWVKAGLKHAMISAPDLPCLLVQRTARLRGKARIQNRFLMYLIGCPAFTHHILGTQTGIGVPHISGQQIMDFEFLRPPLVDQRRIADKLDSLREETQRLESIYRRKLSYLAELKQSILQKAFAGELTKDSVTFTPVAFPKTIANITPIDMHAGILAIAYQKHEGHPRKGPFGHVKAEKIAHMVEAHLGIDLGRNPLKDAAGPNDYRHLKKVEHRAEKAGYFSFKQGSYESYIFRKLGRFDELVQRARDVLGNDNRAVDDLIESMVPMKTQQAEILATVFAAWNNLLIDGQDASNETIVSEARENWHRDKLEIPRDKFFKAIDWMKKKNIVPAGRGKKVISRDDA